MIDDKIEKGFLNGKESFFNVNNKQKYSELELSNFNREERRVLFQNHVPHIFKETIRRDQLRSRLEVFVLLV